jgi:hypothetical protein
MMISPYGFIEQYKDCSYKELIEIRDEYLDSIKAYEAGDISEEAKMICPSPDVIYQSELQYLAELFKLLAEKYSEGKYEE